MPADALASLKMGGQPTLTVVVPMYNEEEVLPQFAARLRPVLDDLAEPYEVLCVDDGSTDGTRPALADLRATWPQLRVVRFRRNAGHQAALTAGLDHATGRWVATIDADLQDPPELLGPMLAAARDQGVDVVYGVRRDRSSDGRFKRMTAGVYYWLMRRLVGTEVQANAGDYRLLSASVVEELRALPEPRKVYRLLIPWLGFSSTSVAYVRDPRAAGSTKYPVRKMVALGLESITSFSAAPLRIATYTGALGSIICFAVASMAVIAAAFGRTVAGWASITVSVLFVGAVQLLCLGLLGEYIGRLFAESRQRPLYAVAEDSRREPDEGRTSGDNGQRGDGPLKVVTPDEAGLETAPGS